MRSLESIPVTRDLVLIGGGHTHALVLRKWAMTPLAGAQVTLINPDAKAPYTGMLPGFVAGHYDRSDLDIDLVKLARQAGARLIIDRAVGIDLVAKRVRLEQRPDISYDTLSIDVGISSRSFANAALPVPIIPAKPLGDFAAAWTKFLEQAEQQNVPPRVAVIGAGIAGVELALAMAHRLKALSISAIVDLIEAAETPLREISGQTRKPLIKALADSNIHIRTNATVSDVAEDTAFIVSAAGAEPHAWLSETGLQTENGYICVDETLQSVIDSDVFAVGDCAHMPFAPRPKAGVFAVRQAPTLFHNLRAHLTEIAPIKFKPQRDYLKLISIGRKAAVSTKWGVGLSGGWVWRWKDKIDRAFMAQFSEPKQMTRPPLPSELASGVRPLMDAHLTACGGCGAKVDHRTLRQGLTSAGIEADVLGSLDDAAIIESERGPVVFTTDHLRAFNSDPYILAKVAAIHALGDVWAMGAIPKSVLANIILPPLSPEKQSLMLAEIMSGANAVFGPLGAKVDGGHTSNGAELTIGFSLIGDVSGSPVKQSGANAGDFIILTKPIGTGVILAAEMQQQADGDDYIYALRSMCRPQDKVAKILAAYATAMTDVTGFGLAGHLFNILDASNVKARLDISSVPFLPGAERLCAQGIRSTLWPANAENADRMNGDLPRQGDLLFDPQTCGGLLACIPAEKADAVFAAFNRIAEPIWKIGSIDRGAPAIELCSNVV
ncbi:MAG: selenide, water dikinase SelD [Pseudomonadota bacterium]